MGKMLRRADDVLDSALDDTVLLLNAGTGRYHGLNRVAARIWELLAQPTDEAALVAILLDEFDVAPDACRGAVANFLAALRVRGLVVDC